MTNLPITVNNSQPTPRGADSPLPRNGSPAVSANAAPAAAQKNDNANTQSADPFGAVLARKIQTDEANASASNASPAPEVDAKTMDSAAQTGKAESDNVPVAAGLSNDAASALIAMLQLPQEIKSPAVNDAAAADAATTATRGISDTAAWITGAMAASRVAAGATMIRETSANKAGTNQLATDAGVIQTKVKPGMAAVMSGKADAAMGVDNLADKLSLRNGLGMENTVSSELPQGIPLDAARSAQGVAQSAASVIASGILPNMLSSDKAANGLQTISSPLGSSGWTEEFSQKITWMGTQQNQVAELHLNPPNLGPLDVVLKISDNQATALFTSPHSAVREAVENALPRLREILADSGITLGNTMVSDQSPRDRSADGLADFGSGAMAQRETSDDALKAEGLLPSSAQTIPVRRHNGMVDTFA